MANPYENDGPTDPFRERTTPQSPPPPTSYNLDIPATAVAGGYSPSVPQFSDDVAKPRFTDSTTAVPIGSAPAAAAVQSADGAEAQTAPQPTSKFWTVGFYQQFFDVNTRQVLIRMSNTLVPINPPDFLVGRNWHYVSSGSDAAAVQQSESELIVDGVTLSRSPDLYGPFWICTTLWMALGIVSNVMSRIAATKENKSDWQYDFSVASVACITMYMYCFVFGAAVWGIMAWKNLPATFTDTICLYGYSMFIFLLTALMCMVPITALQWIFCIVGGLWSTAYLLINFWHMWKASLEPKWFIGIVAFVSAFHLGLTLSFKLYFFNYS